MMSLAGTTIYLHGFGNGRYPSLKHRAEMRKTCGPYQWTVPQGLTDGRGYYAADDAGNPSEHDSTFVLRACERPSRYRGYTTHQDATFLPVVLRLPHGRGFFAGWTMGAQMASSVDAVIFDNEDEAWRNADLQAYSACETENDHEYEDEASQ